LPKIVMTFFSFLTRKKGRADFYPTAFIFRSVYVNVASAHHRQTGTIIIIKIIKSA